MTKEQERWRAFMNITKVVCTMEFFEGDKSVMKKTWLEMLETKDSIEGVIEPCMEDLENPEWWERTKSKLQNELNLSMLSYKTWIDPLELYKVEDGVVYLLAPLKAMVEFVSEKYALHIQEYISLVLGQVYVVKIISSDIEGEVQGIMSI